MSADAVNVGTNERPKVVFWFKIYAGFLCLLYLGVAALSLFFFFTDARYASGSREEARVIGCALLAVGLLFFAACLLPIIVPRRPWVWIYSLVIICLGMGSILTLPAAIPLLIHWIRPETKEWFASTQS